MPFPPVYHHTGLETTGGATRVARLLMAGMERHEIEANLSFELAEKADGAAILPEDFGRYLPDKAIAHVHCTGDWPTLLGSIPARTRTVITLHDCELFTGGCPYPMDCGNADEGCAGPCPRKFSDAAELRKIKLAQVQRLDPVLVAPSRWLARLAKSHLLRPVTIIPNGIPWPDRPRSKPEARQQLGINPVAKVVLFAAHGGMSAAYKSGETWRDIWAELKARLPELVCFAVGGDHEGREGDLILWPYVDRTKLSLLMAAADVMLYPTRADNHSLVIMEAMSKALPVVSYEVGGVPEQIMDQSTGVLVPAGNQKGFIEAAARLLSDPGLVRLMGMEAFVSGRKRFPAERMVDSYVQLYQRMG
ncbi:MULTISPECIES: glycosyltransferase [unclassified Pseudodesulfovibrio]|uniref:glycosyltransferase n=1 Tax=unclassified Pseudodesulfovibrio TaxID=2661612 RepID=UPI000FEBE712|nr:MULTISPECIES: glycosyltransferase [unclassified Pseudodesulfovibrio]MCJ2166036.1 glycosyltransferase [Pseudodesulfovibrio sp. S3-i]RWU02527.1 glycosyltransferase [Pseudodesulfovibrio sp. S3]